jgi:hypothetical protein
MGWRDGLEDWFDPGRCWACGGSGGMPASIHPEVGAYLCQGCWWEQNKLQKVGLELVLEYETPPINAFVNVVLYGPPKTAKTAGAASAPGSTLYVNLDLPNAIRYAHEHHNQDGRIKWVKFKGMETLVDIHKLVHGPASERPDNVVIDPVGDLYRRLLEDASERAVRPSLPTYQAVGTHLERFCRMLCEAPVNAIFICHDHPIKDESTGEMMRLPFTGSASNPTIGQRLMAMVDIIGYTGLVEQEDGSVAYQAQLISAKGRQGGDRFAVLGSVRDTNLAEWFALANAHTSAVETIEVRRRGDDVKEKKAA